MFCELNDLNGKQITSYENNKSKTVAYSNEGRTQQSYVLGAWKINAATEAVQIQRSAATAEKSES